MHRRRAFLTQIPVGLAGLMSACRAPGGDAGASTPGTAATTTRSAASGSTAAGAARPAPLPLEIPAAAPTLRWVPEHGDLVYTFGGAAAKHRIVPGTRIVSWTEDCFDGAVKTASDLASKVMAPGHDNPQTGPFHIEGAEPGDTVAVHLLKIEPARSYGVSAFAPRLRRAGQHRSHGHARRRTCPRRPGGTISMTPAPRHARRRATASTRGRCRSRRSSAASAWRRQPRGPQHHRPRPVRREHGLPRGARRQHRLPRRERAGRAAVVRRRPLRHGRRRDHRRRHRRRDERRALRGAGEAARPRRSRGSRTPTR